MRKTFLTAAALGAGLLAAGPALANGKAPLPAKIDHFAALGSDDEALPVVSPGEEIGIACDALQYTAPGNDVRVVLTIAAAPSDTATAPGYKKVLATNEELTKGAVHVRIPDTPDLVNHIVAVSVYVVNGDAARNCDAGHMRIAERSQHSKRKQS